MRRLLIPAAAAAYLAATTLSAQLTLDPRELRDHRNVDYTGAPTTDPVARLSQRLKAVAITFEAEPVHGYLRSVLKALDISPESQMLVFSKTSFQQSRISPSNPRAIYFNDDVAVGWVRTGDVLEFASHDPTQGTIFYTLNQPWTGAPEFKRNNVSCILCHTSERTDNVPGMFMGSVYPEKDGMPAYGPAYTTDHRTPFELRWGGWYVTARHTGERHLGNATISDQADIRGMVTPESSHVTSLEGRFDMTGYLTPHSDMVALLVMEHQMRALNLLTRVGWEARMGADAKRPLAAAAQELTDYLLFVDEAELPSEIAGTSRFAAEFQARGPRDSKGRSLRDLDLHGRLMTYPLSYTIYSPAFDQLPPNAKALVYQQVWEALSGSRRDKKYARLTAEKREAILEILRETKTDLPRYYSQVGVS